MKKVAKNIKLTFFPLTMPLCKYQFLERLILLRLLNDHMGHVDSIHV